MPFSWNLFRYEAQGSMHMKNAVFWWTGSQPEVTILSGLQIPSQRKYILEDFV